MLPLTERDIRASFLNASRKEASDLSLPPGFADLAWDRLEYLGWTDPRLPRRSYAIVELESGPAGVLLQQAEQRVIARAQCSWCDDVTLSNDVQFFSARKAGPAGRKGDTIGTLVCANFGCSAVVRRLPPLAYEGFDREAARDERIRRLGEHVRAFVQALQA
ncbi:FBP domain-containing protein [Microbacterium marinilacus]|uniref:Elongation factor G-binding protein C-terminal treble-clef zinc-finger domain-containing protein n=1 Tax=Microbacterium marinilacus TaxID=415209 RepID=A0ABP7BBX9_9MICO|nr:FBP domain-containing protein [Microbacterium marinilacus]MBY0687029.1 FBP domain-containing protein [Microbacterium marinilacus]